MRPAVSHDRRMRRTRCFLAAGAATVLFVALPREARAEDSFGFLTVGGLFSFVGGRNSAVGLGGEASFMHYTAQDLPIGFGPFVQGQSYFGSGRYAFGVQAGSFLGVELGGAYRTRDDTHADQWGGHL